MKEEKQEAARPAEAQLEQKVRECQEQVIRLHADFENAKKRLERDKLEAIKFANEQLLEEVLPIMDNLDRAIASIGEGHDPEKVKTGLRLAQEELHRVLERHGVKPVESVGKTFDPNLHEAVAMVETGDAQDGTVLDEVQRGYLLNGRLIRPSRVRVAQNHS